MSRSKTFKICDPLYDYIYLDQGEKSLLSQPAVQRLRSIRQLGFSELAFPSGTNKRFAHSLGVCHLAGKAFDSVFSKSCIPPLSRRAKLFFKKSLRLTGLLHDVGHGPLSHSSEAFMPSLKSLALEKLLKSDLSRRARHEDYGLKLIMGELYKPILRAGGEPEALAELLHPEFSAKQDFWTEKGLNFLPLLRQIISSGCDVDRMDYLARDSLFCGVKYGLIDSSWLISHFDCHIEKNRAFLAIGREGLGALESLILGRQQMRMFVYFHHKSAIYNKMLKKHAGQSGWRLPSDIPSYIQWTDSRLFDKLKSSEDIWAKRIISQRPYLRLYESAGLKSLKPSFDKNIELLKEALKGEGIGFIDINSEERSIKPSKRSKRYNIYLKNRALNQSQPLFESSAFLSFPSRRIQRLYVEPERFSQAQLLLNRLKSAP